ncbi:hypothetical protein LIER_19601 [Lithospermum erythrorhizon]|uniref:Uncharacterized protein n=1 Tax=Lithospermum erythrorhizon TaxID=34254 RepID=A0AAV3QID9_LITER
MAGDEAVLRPPPAGGGHAHPPEPGDPFPSQTAAISHQNPKPATAQAPMHQQIAAISHQRPAILPAHNPAQTLPPPAHSTIDFRENPPTSQALEPSTSAQNLERISPPAAASVQTPTALVPQPCPIAQTPSAAQNPNAQTPSAVDAMRTPSAQKPIMHTPSAALIAPNPTVPTAQTPQLPPSAALIPQPCQSPPAAASMQTPTALIAQNPSAQNPTTQNPTALNLPTQNSLGLARASSQLPAPGPELASLVAVVPHPPCSAAAQVATQGHMHAAQAPLHQPSRTSSHAQGPATPGPSAQAPMLRPSYAHAALGLTSYWRDPAGIARPHY